MEKFVLARALFIATVNSMVYFGLSALMVIIVQAQQAVRALESDL